jgi:hypothetical protein
MDGYYSDGEKFEKCMKHCEKCSSKDKCDVCDEKKGYIL